MNWQLIFLIFGIVLLNTVIVLLILFFFFKVGKKKVIHKKRKISIDKEVFYRRLNFFLFFSLLIIGNWLVFSIIRKDKASVGIGNYNGIRVIDQAIFNYPEKVYPNGLNLIFYADQYLNKEEFDRDVKILSQDLKKFKPWNQYDNYNIYKIFPEKEKNICKIKNEDERKPVLRCSEKINNYLNNLNLKKFKLVVLSRQDFQSWANVKRLDNGGIFFSLKGAISEQDRISYAVLFAHLMGHAFGLKDEEKYVLAKAGGAPHTPDGPNCAPDEKTAKEWWGDLGEDEQVGYFKTCCGSDDYIKPTQSSIMNLNSGMEDFIPTYGPVSERYLQKVLNYCFSKEKVKYEDDKEFFDRYQEFKKCL